MPTAFQCNFGSIAVRNFDYFSNFNLGQCKQTHMCVDKVVKRPEGPFPRVCESVTYGKSRNFVNGLSSDGRVYNVEV